MTREIVKIVMATYNGERYVREQMDSLLGQTYPYIEVEVCDDGSTDDTLGIIREYQEKDDRVTLHVNDSNQGYVKNFLEGMKRSREPYIMLCDQDDIWNPDKVELTLRAMRKAEEVSDGKPILVYTDASIFNSNTKEVEGRFHQNSHLNTKKVDTAHLLMENKVIGCTAMLNQAVLPYLSELPDEIRVHDWWLALICGHFGRIVYVPEPTLLYRQHSDNMIGGTSFGHYIQDRLSRLREQRRALEASYAQGAVFLRTFAGYMSSEQQKTASAFAEMGQAGWFGRRVRTLRYGFWKSGLVRNIGLFVIL